MTTVDPFWELPDDPLPIDEEWIEYRRWQDEREREQKEAHAGLDKADSSTGYGCVVCAEKSGKVIYGGKCQGCFEAQRAEREQA